VKINPGMCSWHEPRQCQITATHYHPIFGTVCGYHARQIEQQFPKDKVKRLKGPLMKQLFGVPKSKP
jgi:hypothetical protein